MLNRPVSGAGVRGRGALAFAPAHSRAQASINLFFILSVCCCRMRLLSGNARSLPPTCPVLTFDLKEYGATVHLAFVQKVKRAPALCLFL